MLWIDGHCRAGDGSLPGVDALSTVEHLRGRMRRLGIGEALVQSSWNERLAADDANEQLFDDVAHYPELHSVPEVLPEGSGRFLDDPAAAIADLARRGAAAGVAFPKKGDFALTRWCAGPLLEAMQDCRLPLMIYASDVPLDQLHDLLHDFPKLPVLLEGLPRTGYNRTVYPLLDKFPNLYGSFGLPHSVHLGFEYMVNRFGAERFYWGTNYPRAEGGAAMTGLLYAEMRDADRAAIAGGNLARLIKEVRRG